ncbi:hypothetical protein N7448_002393 [Penicillium atrosanguineum]|uniref:uncharacterized protein n=1 Tax=Penicillium atrosanguineum TaxID=1132637 RepID=UPI0023A29B79|nr:uncharacterized protein N7443_005795 [Penicillium atrosanguineum]KAJ5145001.1 hypothetical protein N7448_002393 [Penicillium atrosanguineum]KAJ5300793.1 hypothetical protein N7443_005795 [Penicillium atrosanguineum]
MRPSLLLLPLAVLLAQGIHAQAKDIDVCTQVTQQYITNGDFAVDSDWTASEDYTIVTKSGSDSGYMGKREIPFTADSSDSSTVSFQQAVSNINVGPYYQMDFYWDVIVPDDDFRCDLSIYAIHDDGSSYITNAYRIESAGESGWTNVLGQWQSTATEIIVEFQAVCTGGSGIVRVKEISFKGPEIICTSQCAASTLRTTGELIQDGDFSKDDFDDYWSTEGYAYAIDDDAPGGGQCMFIPSDYAYYELNQTIADAQAGQTYHASAMWRLKSPVANGVDIPTCFFDFKIVDLDNDILLDLAHMTYSLTTTDSGWMSINGTWNATVSSVIVNIYVTCTVDDYDYLPDMEIADIHFNLQTVTCATPSPSAVASSTPLRSSVTSTPLVRSTPVSSSVSASSTPVSTPYSTPFTAPTTITISIPQSTPVASIAVSSIAVSSTLNTRSSTSLQSVSSSPSSSFTRPAVSSSHSSVTSTVPVSTTSGSLPAGSSARIPSASGSSPSGVPPVSPAVSTSTSIKASVSSASSYTDSSRTFPHLSISSTSPSISISGPEQASTTAPSSPIYNVTNSSPGPLIPASPTSTTTNDPTSSQARSQLTTSTVFTTQTSTITACPSTVTDCPATAKTTYVTTETIVVSTTVCPVAEAEGSYPTTAPDSDDGSYTSTILTTRTITITSCAATVTNCPERSQTTYISIQTVVAGTTVISAGPIPTISSSTPTETGVETTKSTAVPGEPENASFAGSEKASTVIATDSIASDKTGVSESSNASAGSGRPDSAPTETSYEEVKVTAATNAISANKTGVPKPNTVSAGSNVSESTATESTIGDENEGVSHQDNSQAVSGAVVTGMVSNGKGGVLSASSRSSGVSSGASHTPSTAKAAVASFTLVTAASSSAYHSSTAASVAPVFNGTASLRAAQPGLLGFVAWGLVAILV